MSIRLRIIVSSVTTILVLNAVGIITSFLLFWIVANPLIGARLNDNLGHIAARFFPLGGIVVLVLTAVGTLLIVGLTAKRVTGPMARLKRAVSEIRDGNLGHELVISGDDEFTELATGFEQMRVRLKDSTKIKEKTEYERRAMMASITHDLKTPITSILGYAEGILDGVAETPEKVHEYAAVICKKARSLQMLSDDLSLLSRLENAQLPLDKTEEDLGMLTAEVAGEFRHSEQEMSLEMDIEAGIRVFVDREKIARVILNLLQNSVKYKKPEQLGAKVSMKLVQQDDEALLTVSDQGLGISRSDLPHVFDQFYRADASRGVQSGSGLGLAIAQQLITLHGGKIWMMNNPDAGISVNIMLPLVG
ncbi:MAG: HAMP domain-containing histidine kinase [Oscillospiraceae bacterium]|nr:HAMP domain-containing histidine kinase [Oscillospiraceae bacterium]